MNEKETGELRRRLRPDRCAVSAVYGCYVNEKKEIAANFRQSLAMLPKEDTEAVLQLMRKTLSGGIGRNLLALPFSTGQVMDSDEHRLLSAMRAGGEESEPAIQAFFEQTAAALQMEGSYLILLIQDRYDVPAYGKDGNENEESDEVFAYCIGAVCPIKERKPALGFFPSENALKTLMGNNVIAPPEIGFLFPSFDDRTANIYDLSYYTKRSAENHPEFITEVLRLAPPMPADMQKDAFTDVLEQTLMDDCGLKVAVAVRDTLCEQIAEYKEDKDNEEPLTVSKTGVSRILRDCGVKDEKVERFEAAFTDSFGENASLPPQNLVNTRLIEVETPDAQIKLNSERSDLLDVRIIDGVRYILIRAENGVTVNGVTLSDESE